MTPAGVTLGRRLPYQREASVLLPKPVQIRTPLKQRLSSSLRDSRLEAKDSTPRPLQARLQGFSFYKFGIEQTCSWSISEKYKRLILSTSDVPALPIGHLQSFREQASYSSRVNLESSLVKCLMSKTIGLVKPARMSRKVHFICAKRSWVISIVKNDIFLQHTSSEMSSSR